MSDDEWDTTDDDTSSMKTESTSAESEEKCPYCKIYKSMAESRLFEVPEAFGNECGKWDSDSPRRMSCVEPIPYSRLEWGISRGCRFCGLLKDAITAQIQGARCYSSKVQWSLVLNGGQFLMVCDVEDEPVLTCISRMYISRGTGCQSQWNFREQQVLGDTSRLEAVATARGWLEDCKDKHKYCNHESHAQKTPKRILRLDGEQIKLCENLKPATAYACLSHCWGPRGPAMQLRSDTMSNLKAGVPLDTLPKTFRDAAWFCWRLGILYLWIDALCIIQDDEADWEESAATMADVYESAEITISAAWSNSSEDGCFAPAETIIHGIALSETGLYLTLKTDDFPRSFETRNKDQWPLFKRAWIYQERRISTCILHFGRHQLFWECSSRLLSEKDWEGCELSDWDLKSSEVEKDPEVGWGNVVEHYSHLRLTYEKDRLPATSAVVKKMQRLREGDVYIAGMWKKTLSRDLCWYATSNRLLARPDTSGTVMPTWSWISTSSGVSFMSEPEFSTPLLSPDDTDVVYNITGPAHIGRVSHAELHIKARYMFVKPDFTRSPSFRWDFDPRTAYPPISTNDTLVSLLLSKHQERFYAGIALRELPNKQFERVGHVIHEDNENEFLEELVASLPFRQFTIV